MMNLYVAAPFERAPEVRDLHALARPLGITAVSFWAEEAHGPENLRSLPRDVVRALGRKNDRDLLSAHLVVALASYGAGGEMFAEVRLALAHRIPVLWIGTRSILTAYREGVLRAETLEDGMILLGGFADILSTVTIFEKRKARETLWEAIEALQGKDGGRPRDPAQVA